MFVGVDGDCWYEGVGCEDGDGGVSWMFVDSVKLYFVFVIWFFGFFLFVCVVWVDVVGIVFG